MALRELVLLLGVFRLGEGLFFDPPHGTPENRKPGRCVWWAGLSCSDPGQDCNSDTDCPGSLKCCIYSCGKYYCAASIPEKNDPCTAYKCRYQGEVCVTDSRNVPRCVCPPGCPTPNLSQRVCGSDGLTYPSVCEMYRTACSLGINIRAKYRGPCRPLGEQGPKLSVSASHTEMQSLAVGKPGKLTCVFDGNPTSVTWSKEGLSSLPSRMTDDGNGLVISRVQAQDQGTYTCRASDGQTSVRATITLKVTGTTPVPTTVAPPKAGGLPTRCLLRKLVGLCSRFTVRWYYDSTRRSCLPFVYTGCGGNENNFMSSQQCSTTCMKKAKDNRVCPRVSPPKRCPSGATDQCTTDIDCQAGLKCCSNGCILSCTKPVLPEKRGKCPTQNADNQCSAHSVHECTSDNDCEQDLKCCMWGCHRSCVRPEGRDDRCKAVVDVAFLLDSSGSIRRRHWPVMLNFFKRAADAIGVSDSGSHVASVSYSTKAVLDFTFDSLRGINRNPTEVKKLIDDIRHMRGYTFIDKALALANEKVFVTSTGMREAVKKIAFVLTDGFQTKNQGPYTPLKKASKPLKDKGVEIWAIGIGRAFDMNELRDIASSPTNVLTVQSFDDLDSISTKVRKAICKERALTGCQKQYRDAVRKPRSDGFVPRCKPDGSYDNVQCRGRECYCVDKKGKEIYGTRASIESGHPQCTAAANRLSTCQGAYKQAIENGAIGAHIPRCKADGRYEEVQCERRSTYCWCVDSQGRERQGTRTRGPLVCPHPDDNLTPCQRRYIKFSRNPVAGQYIPWCTPRGEYEWRQCYSSYCFCVDRHGNELRGTRLDNAAGRPKCTTRGGILTPCQRRYQQATRFPIPGAYAPRCRTDGSFEEVQCQRARGYCWCVDQFGNEIPRTRSRATVRCPSLGGAVPACWRDYQDALRNYVLGRFVPWCRFDGNYREVQCHGGFCYCVNRIGQEIKGTRTYSYTGMPRCTHKAGTLTRCQQRYWQAVSSPKPGLHTPRCTGLGAYQPLQCSAATNECWCVGGNGVEMPNTRSAKTVTCPPRRIEGPKIDIGFVVDSSSAVNWARVQSFAKWFVSQSAVSDDGVHFGFVSYASTSRMGFQFNADTAGSYSSAAVNKLIDRVAQLGSDGRRLDLGLDMAYNTLFTLANGARRDARKVLIVFIGGALPTQYQSAWRRTANQLRSIGVKIYVITVGTGLPPRAYFNIGRRVYSASSYPSLDLLRPRVFQEIKPGSLSDCHRRYHEATRRYTPGAFIPRCRPSGAYDSMQCNRQHCYCVNTEGVEVPRTRIHTKYGQPHCKNLEPGADCGDRCGPGTSSKRPILSPCQRRRQLSSAAGRVFAGGYVPHCKGDGLYEEVQCHARTKQCWCVDNKGVEIWGTRTRSYIRCAASAASLTDCQRHYQDVLRQSASASYIPRCTPEGRYTRMQCWGAECFCVDRAGRRLDGTSVRISEGTPDCAQYPSKRRPLDLGILVDTSGELTKSQWNSIINYIQTIVRGFDISDDGTRVGLVPFSSSPRTTLAFNSLGIWNEVEVNKYVSWLKLFKGTQRLDLALRHANDNLFQLQGGMRPNSRKVLLAILISPKSGGVTPIHELSAQLQRRGVSIHVVAVKGSTSPANLKALASRTENIRTPQLSNVADTAEGVIKSIRQGLSPPLDIGVIIDSSSTVNWPQMLQFTKNLLNRFHISQDGDHVGFITYSSSPTVGFTFNALSGKQYTAQGVKQLIDRVVQQGGSGRRVDLALQMALRDLFNSAGGARPSVGKVLILISGGSWLAQYQAQWLQAASRLKDQGVTIYPVAIGDVDISQQHSLAKGESRFFRATGYDKLDRLVPRLAHAIKQRPILHVCQKENRHHVGSSAHGEHIAKCKSSGPYEEIQCEPSSRQCWCADANGNEIPGTRTNGAISCPRYGAKLTHCQYHYQEKTRNWFLTTRHVPWCQRDGSYEPRQCYRSYCFCVNNHGVYRSATRVQISRGKTACAPSGPTKCTKQRLDAFQRLRPGGFVPHCKPDGNFHEKQCHGSYCFCVNREGRELYGTRVGVGQGEPKCRSHDQNSTKCQRKAQWALITGKGHVPRCRPDGSFEPAQCDSASHECWCVNQRGKEIANTRSREYVTCKELGDALATCQRQYQEHWKNSRPGRYVPHCRPDGSFYPVQHLVGMSFCVDQYGHSRKGHEVNTLVDGVALCVDAGKDPTPCQRKRAQALLSDDASHIPSCRPDGSYSPVQCDQVSAECWCAGEDGSEVSGTRTSGTVRCPPSDPHTPCEKKFLASKAPSLAPWDLVPICKPDGAYRPIQCSPHRGTCWCTDINGNSLFQTVTRGIPNCRAPKASSKCQKHRQRVQGLTGQAPMGAYVPRCADDGSYETVQCHGGTPYCWCVDEDGQERLLTRVMGQPNCDLNISIPQPMTRPPFPVVPMTPCRKQVEQALNTAASRDRFMPRCKRDGSYEDVQCQESTGECWCVDAQGTELSGTRSTELVTCPSHRGKATNCQSEYQFSDQNKFVLGRFVPRCTPEGHYEPIQCEGATCYCVNKNGHEIQGTRTSLPSTPNCTNAENAPTVCQYKSQVASVNAVPGAFVPQCRPDGGYEAVQCRGSYCYCVDKRGNEIQGTRLPIADGSPKCQRPGDVLTLCQRQFQEFWKSSIQGRYVPQCDLRGAFERVQCHGPYCFCVDENGEEIRGTKELLTFNPNALFSMCRQKDKRLTLCERKLRDYSLNPPSRGAYKPRCLAGGFYPIQCDTSGEVCWCVDDNGKERPLTRQRGAQVTCPGDPPYLGSSRCKAFIIYDASYFSVFINKCTDENTYQPVQCDYITGYCWCSDAKGFGKRWSTARGKPNCTTAVPPTKCQRHQMRVRGFTGVVPPGRYIPECRQDGSYNPVQCDGSTPTCWCVDTDGYEVPGSREFGQPICKEHPPSVGSTPAPGGRPDCHESRQRALGPSGVPLPGAYIPKCSRDGSYNIVQCHGSTGYCWCVNKHGQEQPGTRKRGAPKCSKSVPPTSCQQDRMQALAWSGRLVVGAFLPRCRPDGSYDPIQCHESPGQCWCVDIHGNELVGTRVFGQVSCATRVGKTACQKEQEDQGVKDLCDMNVGYKRLQCDRSSPRYCWCVDRNGKEIPRTRTTGLEKPICNSQAGLTKCQRERQRLLGWTGVAPPGSLVPECEADGCYDNVQCLGISGFCWCVDSNGNQIRNTRIQGKPVCEKSTLQSPCQKERQRARGWSGANNGAFIPKCRQDGYYDSIQCYSHTCWCSDKYGYELPMTRVTGQGVKPDCSRVPSNFTRCLRLRKRALGLAKFSLPPAVTVPTCEEDGTFSPLQCSELTGYCWCVDKNGNPVFGTEVRGQSDCSARVGTTKCQKERELAQGLPGSLPIVGAFIPECKSNGAYTRKQCHGSTGECWCVDQFGSEESGTRIRGNKLWCDPPAGLSPCLKERRRALGYGVGAIKNRFIPECKPDGSYKEVQCLSSKQCWCVDSNGVEVLGTRMMGKPVCYSPTGHG